jgi:hypothetical protein
MPINLGRPPDEWVHGSDIQRFASYDMTVQRRYRGGRLGGGHLDVHEGAGASRVGVERPLE